MVEWVVGLLGAVEWVVGLLGVRKCENNLVMKRQIGG